MQLQRCSLSTRRVTTCRAQQLWSRRFVLTKAPPAAERRVLAGALRHPVTRHPHEHHESADTARHLGSVELHGNWRLQGPAVVRKWEECGCLAVTLLPGGFAEQASSAGESDENGCLQETVASLDATCTATWDLCSSGGEEQEDAPLRSPSAAAPPAAWVASSGSGGGGDGGKDAARPTVLLFGSLVQLVGDFCVAPGGGTHASPVAEHGGCAVLSIARMGPDGTILLRPGGRITHPLNVHPGCGLG